MKLNIKGIVNITIPVGFTRNSKPKLIPEMKEYLEKFFLQLNHKVNIAKNNILNAVNDRSNK